MNHLEYADEFGTTKEDILIGLDESQREDRLMDIGWDILDLIPAENIKEVQKEIIDLIIEKGWDN